MGKRFYNQLGKKVRWARDVIYGAHLDFGLEFTESEQRSWMTNVGNFPYSMPDVGGYIRDYQTKHLMELHRFYNNFVWRYFWSSSYGPFDKTEFALNDENMAAFDEEEKFQRFSVVVQTGTPSLRGRRASTKFYSYGGLTCKAGMAAVVGQDIPAVLKEEVFASKSQWTNYMSWRETMQTGIDNPCQFVC